MPIRKEIVRKVGGRLESGGLVSFRLGSGYKDSEVTAILRKVIRILERHGIDVPRDKWDILLMKDGDGKNLLQVSA